MKIPGNVQLTPGQRGDAAGDTAFHIKSTKAQLIEQYSFHGIPLKKYFRFRELQILSDAESVSRSSVLRNFLLKMCVLLRILQRTVKSPHHSEYIRRLLELYRLAFPWRLKQACSISFDDR